MSTPNEQANEFAVESLKLLLTLASATLALMVTFLKDIVSGGSGKPQCLWLVIVGWSFLLLSIFLAWIALVEAADRIASGTAAASTAARNGTLKYAFESVKNTSPKVWPRKWQWLSWFAPMVPTKEKNEVRKRAAASQNYFLLGLALSGLFSILNFEVPKAREQTTPSTVQDTAAKQHGITPPQPALLSDTGSTRPDTLQSPKDSSSQPVRVNPKSDRPPGEPPGK